MNSIISMGYYKNFPLHFISKLFNPGLLVIG
jgi:hypothetical protein